MDDGVEMADGFAGEFGFECEGVEGAADLDQVVDGYGLGWGLV